MTLADDILSISDLFSVPFPNPEWGDKPLFIRTLTGTERDAFEAGIAAPGGSMNLANARARLASLVLGDADGNRVFNDSQVMALGAKSNHVLDRAWKQGLRHNGMSADAVEQAIKNSETAPNGGFGSG